MGSGYHGGFGFSFGTFARNRVGIPIQPTEKSLEMALNPELYCYAIAGKYGVNLRGSGQDIAVVYDPNLPLGIYGITSKAQPNVIKIGPSALSSEQELANTIAHELNHARSYLKGRNAPEAPAYKSGDTLSEYIGGLK